MASDVAHVGFICLLNCSKNGSFKSLVLLLQFDWPHTPPSVETTSLMPSVFDVFNLVGSKRTTLEKAVPSQSKHALGASSGRCSAGQMPARNSILRVYSSTSVSPGLNGGIKCQGRKELPVVAPVPSPVLDVGPPPAPSGPQWASSHLDPLTSTSF